VWMESMAERHNDYAWVNNVFDLAPPFVAAAGENGYDEQTANIKGRTWYVALKKRF
jgi:hypothetical protein